MNFAQDSKKINTNPYELLDIIVAFMALFIFFYRLVLAAFPMCKEGYAKGSYRDMALSFTMLV